MFDERYSPCDYEDVDLSYTAIKAQLPLTQLPIPIVHYGGRTAMNLARTAITEANRVKFMEKWGLHSG
jgi:hypothetical protein